ncbi:MAG: 1-deoxy-D-xylulose-5-phosphate reductoisomerase [Deltaproteobacteria bacterium]|nr:1-deoxy-D-xylulose-5-phosphate reductoisomerase [Deltaproteobacteria bacterium]
MKRISILGSTGSIGVNVLNIVRAHPGRYVVSALAAGGRVDLVAEQVREFRPRLVSLRDADDAARLRDLLGADAPRVVCGESGIREVATIAEADMVFSAVVGAAGMQPTWAAVDAGKPVALANKETLVMAGRLILALAKLRGVPLLPVDSEHSAIFQSLVGHNRDEIERIILTASGGPFRGRTAASLETATLDEALAHPTWKMGPKITIDSSTLMNKGLEVIEAHWLFGLPPERIDVVIHPESIIHSMVEFQDGQVIAQLGVPDMRGPIGYALSYPARLVGVMPRLDLARVGRLNFMDVDRDAFACLDLAYDALRGPDDAPAVLNGANEVAVAAFLAGRISWQDIAKINRQCVETVSGRALSTLDDVMEADARAREFADRLVAERGPAERASAAHA